MISSGKSSKLLEAFSKLREADIVGHYFGVTSIPCVITNPLREDLHPSLAFYSPDRIHINYIDFGDKRFRGSLIKFMMKYWNTDFNTTIGKIVKEVNNDSKVAVKAAKDASALVTLATQLDEKLKIYDPILIKGIPVRDKYKVNVKEMRASLAKVVKALEKIKNPIIGIPVRDPIIAKKK